MIINSEAKREENRKWIILPTTKHMVAALINFVSFLENCFDL